MVLVELGSVMLPEELVKKVMEHKEKTIRTHVGTDMAELLRKADFSLWFSDYMSKYGCFMTDLLS